MSRAVLVDSVYRVFEPVAIIKVAVRVLHTSFASDVIPTPPSNVMSAIRTAEVTITTPLLQKSTEGTLNHFATDKIEHPGVLKQVIA